LLAADTLAMVRLAAENRTSVPHFRPCVAAHSAPAATHQFKGRIVTVSGACFAPRP